LLIKASHGLVLNPIIDIIVIETNLSSENVKYLELRRAWKVDYDEDMRKYVGILIMMVIDKKPDSL
jgi:hypothetical protein